MYSLNLGVKALTLSLPRCISELVGIGSIIIFHLSKLWKAKFSILCVYIFWWGCMGKLKLIALGSERVRPCRAGACVHVVQARALRHPKSPIAASAPATDSVRFSRFDINVTDHEPDRRALRHVSYAVLSGRSVPHCAGTDWKSAQFVTRTDKAGESESADVHYRNTQGELWVRRAHDAGRSSKLVF